MALSIRNFTTHPIELTSTERLESEKTSVGNVFKSLGSSISGFLNSTTTTIHEALPKQPQTQTQPQSQSQSQSQSQTESLSVSVPPFHTVETDVRPAAADARHEILRLAFLVGSDEHDPSADEKRDENENENEKHAYEADLPFASQRLTPLRRVNPGAAGPELAALYIPSEALLAIFPSSSEKLNGWMSELDDDWPLSVLSIPGTHNSPTCHTALPSVRCQAVGIPEQLRNGVRFLDVRVSVNPSASGDSRLPLVHSVFPISLTGTKYFADLLEDVYTFLDENPRESILMSIKREGTGKGSDYDLGWCLKREYVDSKGRRDRWWTEPVMPVLGRARGRIVVVRRFALDPEMHNTCWDGRGWGIDAAGWPDNCEDGYVGDGACLRVQDFYEVTESENIEKKITFSAREMERAGEQVFAGEKIPPFFVNFLSASNFFNASCWPERIAAKVNPAMVEYLCARHGREGKGMAGLPVGLAGTGVVVTDWVGANGDWDLIRCVVGMNARLQHMKVIEGE